MQKINFVLNLDKVYHGCYNNYSRSLIDCDCEKLIMVKSTRITMEIYGKIKVKNMAEC